MVNFSVRSFVNGFSNMVVSMPAPPPLVSVASSDSHPHYVGQIHQQQLPDVCVPVTFGVTQPSSLSQAQLGGVSVGLPQQGGCAQAMVISPPSSPSTRMDSYNIPVLAGNDSQEAQMIATKQLSNTHFIN